VCADFGAGRTSDLVFCYPRNADGSVVIDVATLQPVIVVGSRGVGELAFSPDGSRIFAAGENNNLVYVNSVSGTQTTQTSFSSGGSFPQSVAIDATGKWAAVYNNQSGNVALFNISSATVSSGVSVATSGTATGVAFSATGAYLFVATTAGVEVFKFDPTSGTPTPLSGYAVGGSATGMVAH
jgi:DNA-binding beta-propeller fold protein YncE